VIAPGTRGDASARDGARESWRARAADAPPALALPFDPPQTPAVRRTDHVSFSLPRAAELRGVAAAHGVEAGAVVPAAFVALLHRYADETDLLLADATPAGIGLARIDASGDPTFAELLRRTDRALIEAAAAPQLPSDTWTVDGDGPAATDLLAHAAFATAASPRDVVPAVPCELTLVEVGTPDGAEHARLRYRADRFDRVAVERLAGHLDVLLRAAMRDPSCPVRTLPLLTEDERATQREWNATQLAYRTDADLVELLREQAARTPEAVAVTFDDQTLTYAELDARANRLGAYLRRCGVGRETLVAILVERSLDMIVAVLGVHRAGGAYVPIDPGYPPDRMAFMLSDSGAPVVVTQDHLRPSLPPTGARIVSLDAERAAIAAESPDAPAVTPGPAGLAYVIYTSGSTGRPKGVPIEHRSVVNFLAGIRKHVTIGPGDTLIALAPLAFDISGLDIYLSLTAGARMVVASRETAVNPRALVALFATSGATHVQATPSTWRMVIEGGWQGSSGMTILCGGEALPQQLADRLALRAKTVWNLYGPTEATIWATMQQITAGTAVSIGRPMANVAAYVLDAALQPLPPGVRGELFIAGDGLARGYLNRPELTAERFVADPAGAPGARMYRTGDLARFRSDGSIDFLGRADFQVKLRGYRIELGEIEAALEAQPGVGAAVVVVRDNASGEAHLVGYVTAKDGTPVTSTALRSALGERLPAYMVPDVVVILDAMPLNTNGKIDRAKLPAPARPERDDGATPYTPPRTPLERQLTTIWEDVLGIAPIGVTDDFFALGATSIIAARLFDRMERDLGATLPLSPLFQAPTIERLAALIGGGRQERRLTSLVAVQPHGTQTPIFCVHGGAGTILHFQPLARQLSDDQPFYGLQLQGLYGDAVMHLTIEAMATHYLAEIATVQPAGPYRLAGYCFGAIVAVEMARQLRARGETVTLLANFNGPSPGYIARFGNTPRPQRAPSPRPRWTLAQRVRVQFTARRWQGRFRPLALRLRKSALFLGTRLWTLFGRPLPDVWREAAIYELCAVAELRYRPAVSEESMLMFYGAGLFREPDLGWQAFFPRGLEAHEIPGDHQTQRDVMHEPFVDVIADRLRATERPSAPRPTSR